MLNTILPDNFILLCDVYKAMHKPEYPQDTELLYSVLVPRKASKYTDEIVVMGQTYLSHYLSTVYITSDLIDEAEEEINGMGFPFDRESWEIIRDEFDGHLPLTMFGVEEGRVVSPQTPVVAFIATDKRFGWLASMVETIAQSCIWKMSTVASMCRAMRMKLEYYLELCGEEPALAEYMLHNFGDRGAADPEEAVRSAISHAVFFSGSDCLNANRHIKKLYGTKRNYLSSVEATEHSVMCSWSDPEFKNDFLAANMAVDRLYDAVERSKRGIGIPVMSVVIDTYDSHRFVDQFLGVELIDKIMASGGKLVCRPDSGDPLVEPILIMKLLAKRFGFTFNAKGFMLLPPCVGVIQGDGINEVSLPQICENVVNNNFSIAGIVFGMGGGLTHRGQRDDFSWSQKSTARFDGKVWHDLLKEPITDRAKKSLTGLVRCVEVDGKLQVVKASGIKELYETTKGWRIWYQNGLKIYTQDFEATRRYGRMKNV